MFLFIVVLLLVNPYSGSWGAPTHNVTMLSDLLNDLANNCENQFLSTQIKSKMKECQVPVPPYHEKQFECLFFYDINKQLCEAVASSKLAFNEDYTSKILEEQDVSQLCNTAKDWTFTDMGEVYKKTVKVVFHDPVRCSKVCSVESEDILSVDSTFFCKYFKWGSEMLKTRINVVSAVADSAPVVSAQTANSNVNTKIDESVTQNKMPDVKTEISSVIGLPPKQPEVIENKLSSDKAITTKIEDSGTGAEVSVVNKAEDVNSVKQTDGDNDNTKNNEVLLPVVVPANAETVTKEQQQQPTQKNSINKDETTSNISKNIVDSTKKATLSESKKGAVNNELLNQLENPKPKEIGDPDDYQVNDVDSEEGRDGLPDPQGDDIDDPSLTDLETKLDQDLNKKPVKSVEPPIYNNDISQKEYSNAIPDGFSEDDDHFFPFFLTAIIMVILIYVLYHNKSKVSKVFLGLIVEGRQSGRRRNSRGHAYRRLDTLEQAMSTNTAAPPSKIIY